MKKLITFAKSFGFAMLVFFTMMFIYGVLDTIFTAIIMLTGPTITAIVGAVLIVSAITAVIYMKISDK